MAVSKSPFELLGVATTFDLDVRDLERRQRDLAKALHPDRHTAAAPSERRAALNQAIAVTEAYRVLRDPLSRAEALLTAFGRAHEDGESHVKLPPALLMDVLEQREELALARRQKNKTQVQQTVKQSRVAEQDLLAQLTAEFNAATLASEAPQKQEKLDAAETSLARLRYVRKLLDEARAVEDELDAN